MQNFFEVTIDKDRLVIKTTDGFVLSNTLNSVALDEKENILIVGESPENVQESSPDKWNHIKSRAHFVNPFSPDDFRPEIASIVINHSAASAVHLLPEEQKKIVQDLTKWQIHFVEYEKLDKKSREAFEYYIQKHSWNKIKSLSINNQPREVSKFYWIEEIIKTTMLLPSIIVLFSFAEVVQLIRKKEILPPIPDDKIIWLFIASAVILLVLMYLSSLAYIVMLKLFFKNIIPAPIYQATVVQEETRLKRLVNWFRHTSVTGNGG